jgi:hypothetical protein
VREPLAGRSNDGDEDWSSLTWRFPVHCSGVDWWTTACRTPMRSSMPSTTGRVLENRGGINPSRPPATARHALSASWPTPPYACLLGSAHIGDETITVQPETPLSAEMKSAPKAINSPWIYHSPRNPLLVSRLIMTGGVTLSCLCLVPPGVRCSSRQYDSGLVGLGRARLIYSRAINSHLALDQTETLAS